jgi:hypothetical protein
MQPSRLVHDHIENRCNFVTTLVTTRACPSLGMSLEIRIKTMLLTYDRTLLRLRPCFASTISVRPQYVRPLMIKLRALKTVMYDLFIPYEYKIENMVRTINVQLRLLQDGTYE